MRYQHIEGFVHFVLEDGESRTIREVRDAIRERARVEVNGSAVTMVLSRMADEGLIQRIEVRPMKPDRQLWFRKLEGEGGEIAAEAWSQTCSITAQVMTIEDWKAFARAVNAQSV